MKSKNLHVGGGRPGTQSAAGTAPSPTEKPRQTRARGWWWAWGPVLLWAALIFVLSSLPGSAYPHTDLPNADKLVHFALYGTLGALCARALLLAQRSAAARIAGQHPSMGIARGHRVRAVAGVATLLTTLYGVTDELHQLFVPGRSADWKDAVADAVGGLIGAALVLALFGRRGSVPR
jgi:VanZ family protein